MNHVSKLLLFCVLAFGVAPLFAQEGGVVSEETVLQEETQPPLSKEQQKQLKKEAKRAAAEKKRIEKIENKRKKRERTDSYLGVVYLPVHNFELRRGNVELVLRGSTGSFNFYAVNKRQTAVPVLSDIDDASSSYFSVLIDGTEYRLNHDSGISPEVRDLEESGQLAYMLENKMQVVIEFMPVASVPGASADMLRLTVYTTSLAPKTQTVAVKGLFDTILGENTDYHFHTFSGRHIDAEAQFLPKDEEKWLVSTNGKTSVQFLFAGKAGSAVEAVTVANRDELKRSRWIPLIKQDKGFNGVMVYNNSALAVSWPEFELEPAKTKTVTMFIALASDGEEPKGNVFLEGVTVDPAAENQEEAKIDKTGFVIRKPDVEFIVPPITDKQLDPAYIQQLIDRIDSLQSDPKLVDRTEIRQLNAELDAILAKIRQQR
ncbi:MAG: hypothetical protein K6G80_02515 [Treponema sp.]|nr:hypothetical protein [Treponema sp.]